MTLLLRGALATCQRGADVASVPRRLRTVWPPSRPTGQQTACAILAGRLGFESTKMDLAGIELAASCSAGSCSWEIISVTVRREVVVLTAVVAMTAACGRMPAHPTATLRADDLSRLAASPAVSAPTDSASPIQEPVATPPVSAAAPTNPPPAARPATEPPAPTLKVCIGSGEPWRFGATGTSVAGQVRVTWSLPGGCPIWTGVLTSTYGLSVQVSGPAGQYL